mmetsp:Transcript_24848/g.61425  ORF Transcript_24848/g.61425 Transcript_24848/m.61425 type:complete len:84 (-) Transcript_24848:46-297(-)
MMLLIASLLGCVTAEFRKWEVTYIDVDADFSRTAEQLMNPTFKTGYFVVKGRTISLFSSIEDRTDPLYSCRIAVPPEGFIVIR